jgi:hypothetical protein
MAAILLTTTFGLKTEQSFEIRKQRTVIDGVEKKGKLADSSMSTSGLRKKNCQVMVIS